MPAGGFVVGDGQKAYPGKLTPFVLFTCVVAAMGGLIFGYDIGISAPTWFFYSHESLCDEAIGHKAIGQETTGQETAETIGHIGQDAIGRIGQDALGHIGHNGQDAIGHIGQGAIGRIGQDALGHIGHPGHIGQDSIGSTGQDATGSIGHKTIGSIGQAPDKAIGHKPIEVTTMRHGPMTRAGAKMLREEFNKAVEHLFNRLGELPPKPDRTNHTDKTYHISDGPNINLGAPNIQTRHWRPGDFVLLIEALYNTLRRTSPHRIRRIPLNHYQTHPEPFKERRRTDWLAQSQTKIWQPGGNNHRPEARKGVPSSTKTRRINYATSWTDFPYPDTSTYGENIVQRLYYLGLCISRLHPLNLDTPKIHHYMPKIPRIKESTKIPLIQPFPNSPKRLVSLLKDLYLIL